MYDLTDYSEQELAIIAEANADLIHIHTEMEKNYDNQSPDMKIMMEGKRRKNAEKLRVFREHNVHLLTSLQIVKDREKVLNS